MDQTTEATRIPAPLTISDADSALGEDSGSSLTSLTDSIREFREENGRTYHALSAGKYWLPNDERENERLDLQHHAYLLTWDGRLCVCPKNETSKRVLDLGTGTGIWAIDYADQHPESEVIGVDLSPIQPEFAPPNCSFEVDDLEKEWTWSKKFDFIYGRALLGCFSDLQSIVQKCYDNLEPGGYLEMHDGTFPLQCDDGSLSADSVLLRITKLVVEAAARLGRPIDLAPRYKEMFENAGFVDVQCIPYKWPINHWPREPKMKKLGLWSLADVDSGWDGMYMALFTRGLGMSKEEVLLLAAAGRKELRDTRVHAYWAVYCCNGKKPEPPVSAGSPEQVTGSPTAPTT